MDMITSLQPISDRQFRDGMQLLAATTTVITTRSGEQCSGLTATAVCSLSNDPGSLLISLNRSSRTQKLITKSGHFAVNLLAEEQRDVAMNFADSGDDSTDQFSGAGIWQQGTKGIPVLQDALGVFTCKLVQSMETRTHSVMCGRILECALSPDRAPLVYYKREFVSV